MHPIGNIQHLLIVLIRPDGLNPLTPCRAFLLCGETGGTFVGASSLWGATVGTFVGAFFPWIATVGTSVGPKRLFLGHFSPTEVLGVSSSSLCLPTVVALVSSACR